MPFRHTLAEDGTSITAGSLIEYEGQSVLLPLCEFPIVVVGPVLLDDIVFIYKKTP